MPDKNEASSGPPDEDPELTRDEEREVEQRSALRVQVVHAAIRREGEDELQRPTSAPAWSGLAAGLSMGFAWWERVCCERICRMPRGGR
jgi:hypothetical protein